MPNPLFPRLAARKKGWLLTVTTDLAFGLRVQVELSPATIRKMGGREGVFQLAGQQSQERKKPLAIMDSDGAFVFKSANWPPAPTEEPKQ